VILGDVRDHASSDTEFDTDWDDLSGIDVLASEFATTTADASSSPIYEPVSRLLQRVRERAGMDVVFIAQFVNGKRLVRHVAADPRDRKVFAEGHADPLEATYCKRVLDGRLPEALPDALQQPESAHLPVTRQKDIRAHIAVPVVTRNGRVFGTLCAYSHQPRAQLEDPLAVLRSVADALARALEQAEAT
jgi:GAF domain-containing protein